MAEKDSLEVITFIKCGRNSSIARIDPPSSSGIPSLGYNKDWAKAQPLQQSSHNC